MIKAPFPYFGGKSRVAHLVWERFGNVPNYVEPFAGSLAVLLQRPHAPGIETVNDRNCVAPQTRILKADLSWASACEIKIGDELIAFDEQNGEARIGLRAPKRYRRLAKGTVTHVRTITKPCYRLTFDDGTTVTCSEDHMWLGGSHKSGGRGWRWVKTKNMVCDRKTQKSWVLKVADVVSRENSHEAGWVGGFLDGEGNINVPPGMRVVVSQNEGPLLDRAEELLAVRGFCCKRGGKKRCRQLTVNGGIVDTLSLLMRFRPERLIRNFVKRLGDVSLYGREHRAIGLVSKEFIGEQPVVAIETDCHTFIAEGIASHNCMIANFWRALKADPDEVAHYADWPVNEADQHARHLWLCSQEEFRERMKTDADYYDSKIAGYWVWGQCIWIGSGWCSARLPHLGNAGTGVHRKLPHLGDAGRGMNRQLPHLGDAGRGDACVNGRTSGTREGLLAYMRELADRLRYVRVCCGDWARVCGPSPTVKLGTTGVFLDPPYASDRAELYAEEDFSVSHEVRKWAILNGENPDMRIALCGYEGEHEMPDSWISIAWKARGGYGSQGDGRGRANANKERIWFSRYCLSASLFDQIEVSA